MKDKYPFLEQFVGDWPIKDYLKKHLTNKRHYNRYSKPTARGSGYNIAMDDIFNFGSDEDARFERGGDKDNEDSNKDEGGDEGDESQVN
jgi:hypothetical protein